MSKNSGTNWLKLFLLTGITAVVFKCASDAEERDRLNQNANQREITQTIIEEYKQSLKMIAQPHIDTLYSPDSSIVRYDTTHYSIGKANFDKLTNE